MSSVYIPSYRDLEVSYTVPKTGAAAKAIVHYVEAGDPRLPKFVLLHGFPASSYQYRDFIPMVSDKYHVLAPDFPGFGNTKVSDDFEYNFENLTAVTAGWLKALGIAKAAIYIQDYGAPVGLRLAITGGLEPSAIVTQNGNAYEAGIGKDVFGPIMDLWRTNSPEHRKIIADNMLTLEGAKEHYTIGTPEKDYHLFNPDAWVLAYTQNLAGPVNQERQLSMLYDYRTNVELYPQFQKYMRESKVPVLAAWGKGDLAFIYPGAEAFKNDCPDAEIHLLDAGHFALETVRWEIARLVRQFLGKIDV